LVKIAVDAMGGDYAPLAVIQGVNLALSEYDLQVSLVGRKAEIQAAIDATPNFDTSKVDIVDATDVVEMNDSPFESFKKKKNSSIKVGLDLVKQGAAQGFISAGNTGAMMFASTLILGKLPNIDRPAIMTMLPTNTKPVMLLDVGACVDCKPHFLLQFAEMANIYAKEVQHNPNPRIGLLNIGEESSKGNELSQKAFQLLSKSNLNFVGNVEGKDFFSNKADIVVCDGFVGNNMLKFGEGVVGLVTDFLKSEGKSSFLSALGLLLLQHTLKRFRKKFDYSEYGGAPLLGLNGVSIVAHGSSNRVAIKSAINNCLQTIQSNMVEKISQSIK